MQHIVVIADQTGGKNFALHRALALSKKSKLKITLLGFCYANIDHIDNTEYAKLSKKALERKLIKLRTTELEQIAQSIAGEQHKLSITVQWSKDITPAVIAFCKTSQADLLIKTVGNNKYLLKSSTDWRLLRECPCPVMIATNKSWRKKANVLAAVDLASKSKTKQKLNDTIVEHAKNLAELTDSELHIAYSIKLPQALIDLDIINSKDYVKNKKTELKPIIESFCECHSINKDQLHIRQGSPDRIIPSIANKLKVNLVVCGTVGRKGIKGKLVGNTAESILENLHTEILAIKP